MSTSPSNLCSYVALAASSALVGGAVAYAVATKRCSGASSKTCAKSCSKSNTLSVPQLPTEGGRTWFSEVSDEMWPGQAMSLEVSKVICHKKSKLQDILVFDSTKWGRVLCLDGVIQTTDKDEAAYQEAMAHTPAFLHPSPKKALVVGGGDGGVLRELAKHESFTELHICEIDGEVIETTKEHLKSLSVGFSDPRVIVHLEDGCAFMKKNKNEFDVIVCDTSDPVGPAQTLFSNDFYDAIYNALTPNGVAATQGECYYLSLDLISRLVKHSQTKFADVKYADIRIPTYPCGQIGCLVLAKGKGAKAEEPVRAVPKAMASSLKYYSSKLHRDQFTLPAAVHRAIYGSPIES